jgi:hypothetical protein
MVACPVPMPPVEAYRQSQPWADARVTGLQRE